MSDSPKSEFRGLTFGYAGFQMATALLVVSNASNVWSASIVVSLFAISVPSTVAYGWLARITKEDEVRNPNPISGNCGLVAVVTSIAALSLLLWPVSRFAAIAFPITCIVWIVVTVRLRKRTQNASQVE